MNNTGEEQSEERENSPTVSQQIVSDDDEIDYSVKPEFYDPKIDEKDEEWVLKKRKGHTSDAILSCPACFTTLCLDCQRHEKYVTQYRAMFVINCKIKEEAATASKSGSKRKRSRNKHKSDENNTDSVTDGVIRKVCCAACLTQVGVVDEEEVYHFCDVLPSQS